MNFKAGDIVVAVETMEVPVFLGGGTLKIGNKYKVRHTEVSQDGERVFVKLEGFDYLFYATRFKIYNDFEIKTEQDYYTWLAKRSQ